MGDGWVEAPPGPLGPSSQADRSDCAKRTSFTFRNVEGRGDRLLILDNALPSLSWGPVRAEGTTEMAFAQSANLCHSFSQKNDSPHNNSYFTYMLFPLKTIIAFLI